MFCQAAAEAFAWLISLTTAPEGRRCWNDYYVLVKTKAELPGITQSVNAGGRI